MGNRVVKDCDCCSAKNIAAIPLCLCVDRTPAPAGSMENDYENFDLCPECVQFVFRVMKAQVKLSHEDAGWIAARIKEHYRAAIAAEKKG